MIGVFLKKYILVVNIILITALAYVFAQVVNDKIKGGLAPPPRTAASSGIEPEEDNSAGRSRLPSSRSSYNMISQRNIFGLKNTTSSAPSNLNPDEVPQTSLNLELLGTVIKPGQRSNAVIKNLDTGKIEAYLEGEFIDIISSERVWLSRIENCIAVVERNQGPETVRCKKDISGSSIALAPSSQLNKNTFETTGRRISTPSNTVGEGVREVREGLYEVDQRMLEQVLSDPNQLVNQARVIPQDNGLRFFAIRPDSLYFKIGIRNGDILHRINDVELSNVENALKLFEELRGESGFKVDLSRGGQNLTYEYIVR